MTFLRNHMNVTAACDFFIVPSLSLRRLYALVVLEHDRRRIRHVAVTAHPSVAWTAAQLARAYPEHVPKPKFLIHDREKTFRMPGFLQQLAVLGIEDKRTGFRQHWQNMYCERVIGTLRRECTDHLLALNSRHLERFLREYVKYYNATRTHMSLQCNAPLPRAPAMRPASELRGIPPTGRVASPVRGRGMRGWKHGASSHAPSAAGSGHGDPRVSPLVAARRLRTPLRPQPHRRSRDASGARRRWPPERAGTSPRHPESRFIARRTFGEAQVGVPQCLRQSSLQAARLIWLPRLQPMRRWQTRL
jgi:hypothetical protein